jgi:hypothetical protein
MTKNALGEQVNHGKRADDKSARFWMREDDYAATCRIELADSLILSVI